MQKKYSIYGERALLDQQLTVIAGSNYLAMVSSTSNILTGLEYFSLDREEDGDIADGIRNASQLLQTPYSESHLFYMTNESVIVPGHLFNPSAANDMLNLVFAPAADTQVHIEHININPALVHVYRVSDEHTAQLSQLARFGTRRHGLSKVVETLLSENTSVICYVNEGSVTIAAQANGQLKIARDFTVDSPEDILYHITHICRQFELDPTSMVLSISGFVEKGKETAHLLQKYFPNLAFAVNKKYRWDESVSNKYPTHYFTAFINLLP